MPHAHRPSALRGCVFRKRDVLADGLLTPAALRSSAWRRLFRGIYADADLPDSFGLRIRGARLLLPDGAVFSGRTAAYLHGAGDLVDVGTPVEVSVPTGVRFGPVTGLRIRQVALPQSDVTSRNEWRLTTRIRTALDIVRTEPLIDAVASLDVLLARRVVDEKEFHEAVAALPTGRGAAKARRAAGLADPRAASRPESRLRVALALAGLLAVPQFTVRDGEGRFVARVDLAFPAQRLAIEYDGAWHAEPGQFARDRRRLNELVAAGWTVLHVTAADMREITHLVARVKALLTTRNFGEVAL